MKLSIVMPVYNERDTIEEILRQVMALELEKEIILVDDCSTDGTREWLRERKEGGGMGSGCCTTSGTAGRGPR